MIGVAGGILLLIHTGLTAVLQLASLALPALSDWLGQPSLLGLVLRAVVMQGGLILLPTLAVLAAYRVQADDVIGGRSRPGSLILAAVIGVPAAVVFQGLNNLLLYFLVRVGWQLPAADTASTQLTDGIWQKSGLVILVVILIQVLIPAVAEELMFRGVIQGSLRSRGTSGAAIFWQAVAFALFHNEPQLLLPPFLAGLLLGFLRHNSGSLLPALLAHASLNLSLLAITPILPRLTANYLDVSMQSTGALFYASLIATFVAAVALVPLLVLLGHLHTLSAQPSRLRRIYPGDWKFTLALLTLIATMMMTYYQFN